MQDSNRFTLSGVVSHEPVQKKNSAIPSTLIILAVSSEWNGDHPQIDWHNVVCTGRLSRIVDHFKRGQNIRASGRVQIRQEKGVPKYLVIADSIVEIENGVDVVIHDMDMDHTPLPGTHTRTVEEYSPQAST
jgi:primosomal replication protein N